MTNNIRRVNPEALSILATNKCRDGFPFMLFEATILMVTARKDIEWKNEFVTGRFTIMKNRDTNEMYVCKEPKVFLCLCLVDQSIISLRLERWTERDPCLPIPCDP